MSNKVDLKKFRDAIEYEFAQIGKRCKDVKLSDEPEVVTAAIASTAIEQLLYFAEHKLLSKADISIAYCAFMSAAGMETYHDQMGFKLVRRVQ